MAMLNFDTDLDQAAVIRQAVVMPIIEDRIVTRPSEAKSHAFTSDWGWQELRDYVVEEIESRFGPFPREPKKEYGIFNSFLSRWGTHAVPIARYAFESCDGMWRGAPVSVFRFCKGSDPYMACIIAQRLGFDALSE